MTHTLDYPLHRSSRAIVVEVIGFVALAYALKAALSVVVWKYAGPLSLYILVAVMTVVLSRQGLSWREFGLVKLETWRARLLILPQAILALVAFVVAVAPILLLGDYFKVPFLTEVSDGVDERFGAVEGNLPMFLLWLAIVWTAAAFGEEMVFRGYLVTRLKTICGDSFLGSALAVVIPALLFGLGHVYYQGLRGLVVVSAIGIAFGTVFLLTKRNLWPIILLHGLIDTVIFTSTYLGVDPAQ